MKVSQLKKIMANIEAPMQPFLQFHTLDYEQLVIQLNPFCEKGGALVYQFTTDSRTDQSLPLVPDACVDILFSCDPKQPGAWISGYRERAETCSLQPNTTYWGIKPYSGFLGLRRLSASLAELDSGLHDLSEVISIGSLREEIASASSIAERAERFQAHWSGYWDDTYVASLPGYISLCLCCSGGNLSLDALCQNTGYSGRYCRRAFHNSYQLSIKSYSKMIRFQNALRMLLDTRKNTSNLHIACANGYYDEAHFIQDFKSMAGTSPSQFRGQVFQKAG